MTFVQAETSFFFFYFHSHQLVALGANRYDSLTTSLGLQHGKCLKDRLCPPSAPSETLGMGRSINHGVAVAATRLHRWLAARTGDAALPDYLKKYEGL